MNQAGQQAMLDKEAIRDLQVRYSRAVARCDADLLRSVYHPDGRDNHGVFDGNNWDFVDFIIPRLQEGLYMVQIATAWHRIEISGDDARGEVCFMAFELSRKDTMLQTGGRYLDRYQRRDGEWRIFERVVVNDWNRRTPIEGLGTNDFGLLEGAQGPDDVSYSWFA